MKKFNYTDENITVCESELLEDTTCEIEECDTIVLLNSEWETVYEK